MPTHSARSNSCIRIQGLALGCGVWGVGCGVWGVGCGVWGVGWGVKGFASGVEGSRFRVKGVGFRVQRLRGWGLEAVSMLVVGSATVLGRANSDTLQEC